MTPKERAQFEKAIGDLNALRFDDWTVEIKLTVMEDGAPTSLVCDKKFRSQPLGFVDCMERCVAGIEDAMKTRQ